MTYVQLLETLQARTGYTLLCGNADATLIAATAGRHPDAFLGEVISMIYVWCALSDIHAEVDRAAVVNALGPLRRRYMAGEGCAADFRRLNHIIEAIDAAFDAAVQPGQCR
ncbi:hypothetical protein SFMTTN_0420 [Sulfuriferula multivorans]|uniref:Uncharacterized protein n=1 Tax=Sulfuriferula multivorans TaxID=1559896 RepID=A0A401JAP3_9PROT|nr:hypothetical protein [Sulfuriferula multivorans]GBL44620.1 hypothetical protein SFMTTN_0420 [Sulfuriferula multivorans]